MGQCVAPDAIECDGGPGRETVSRDTAWQIQAGVSMMRGFTAGDKLSELAG